MDRTRHVGTHPGDTLTRDSAVIRAGGIALISGAGTFVAVFAYLAAAVAGLMGTFRHNYLLPLWMIVFGVKLLRSHSL